MIAFALCPSSARASGCSGAGDARRLRRRRPAKEHPAGGQYRPRVLMRLDAFLAVPVMPYREIHEEKRATASLTLLSCKTGLTDVAYRKVGFAPPTGAPGYCNSHRLVTLAVQSHFETIQQHCSLPVSRYASKTYSVNCALKKLLSNYSPSNPFNSS